MRVAMVSTYAPRQCGIAAFSSDLRSALLPSAPRMEVGIASLTRSAAAEHPAEVMTTIRQDVLSDYSAAAGELSARVDVVLIEHEFGIFGGEDGEFVLTLARGLSVPFVVTLHTVLSTPSVAQASILRELCRYAAKVMVFTETARRMIIGARLADSPKVHVVPHGVPDRLCGVQGSRSSRSGVIPGTSAADLGERTRAVLDQLEERTVLATFGLICESKGLELVLDALPSIVAAHPEVCYLIAGQTHPEVVRQEGERYRRRLQRRVRELGLNDHVMFLDHFLTVEELAALLGRTDLYLTPYRSREQIVSGALTFAVAAGCAVVSTPYFYAEDLLASGAGVLVPFDEPAALGAAVRDLLADPRQLAARQAEARRVGARLGWRRVGQVTGRVLAGTVRAAAPSNPSEARTIPRVTGNAPRPAAGVAVR